MRLVSHRHGPRKIGRPRPHQHWPPGHRRRPGTQACQSQCAGRDGYALVTVRLAAGPTVRGFARKETLHGLQLQTTDGRLLLLGDGEYQIVSRDKGSAMPALNAAPDEHRGLVAFLSRLVA